MSDTHSASNTNAFKNGTNGVDAKKSAPIVSLAVRDGIAVITFDDPEAKVNTLSEKSSRELAHAFDEVMTRADVKGAVLVSGKSDGFIVGADVKMLEACRTSSEVERLSKDMQTQLSRLEESKKPVVAAINGACLGGGLEVALACHWRIATDHAKTALALPEVMLGLLPGGGGTQRLPRLIGIQAALDMMLTGKNIRAHKAKKMGLVDDVVVPYGLTDTAIATCQKLIDGKLKRRDRKLTAQDRALEENPAGRLVLFHQARATVMEKTRGVYPSPLAIIDVVEAGVSQGMTKGYEEESRRFGELAMTPEAKSLMSLFFGQTALKKNRFGKPDVDVKSVGVLGAGLMGSGIALVTAQKGIGVRMKDVSLKGIANGQKGIFTDLDKKTKRKAMTSFERDQTMARIIGQTDYRGFENCDIVIEAVFEDLKLKHRVVEEVEAVVHKDCVFASNTSALPITDIARASKRPENIVGMHYFSPVPKMPLLEVITTEKTSKRAAALAVDVGLKQGKTVIVVKDGPGFYTTRILAPFMDEAAQIGLEGVDFHAFDGMMMDFGFPVGPITLLDEVGIDVGAHVAKDMAPFFAPRFGERDTRALDEMVALGFLGRKSGKGFYVYDKSTREDPIDRVKSMVQSAFGKSKKGKPVNVEARAIFEKYSRETGAAKKAGKVDVEEIQMRMTMRMVNEAVLCLQDGILESPVDGDIGAVFGLGFPPFRGGPFRFVDTTGPGAVVSTMERLAQKHGKRFEPCALLVEHAKKGKKFHA